MAMNDPAVNQFHQTLRVLTLDDPTFESAIAFGQEAIRLRGYDAVKQDPGMVAWVMENQEQLVPIARKRKGVFDA